MAFYLRANMTTGNVRILPVPPEKKYLGGRALVSQILYTEMTPNADPLAAGNTLVFAAGLFAGSPLGCFDMMVIGAKCPETGKILSIQCMSRSAVMMVSMGIRYCIFEGIPSHGTRYIMLIDSGSASLIPIDRFFPSEYRPENAISLHKNLHDYFDRNFCIISPASADNSSQMPPMFFLSRAEKEELKAVPSFGIDKVMTAKGICAFVLHGENLFDIPVSSAKEKELCQQIIRSLRCIRYASSPANYSSRDVSLCRLCAEKNMAEQVHPISYPPIRSLSSSSPLQAVYDSLGLCSMSPILDHSEELLKSIVALARQRYGERWDTEKMMDLGRETIKREQAFNNWALSSCRPTKTLLRGTNENH